MYIYDKLKGEFVEAKIVKAEKTSLSLKKNGWQFNWHILHAEKNSETYIIQIREKTGSLEGALNLKIENEMMIMNAVEIAPHNISGGKKFDHVAGCLIAFACRKSFSVDSDYKGYLTFVAKTELIKLYSEKYGAQLALGQRMFIDPEAGIGLIDKYLNDKERWTK